MLKSQEIRALKQIQTFRRDTMRASLAALAAAEKLPNRHMLKVLPSTYGLINSIGRVASRRESDKRTDAARRKLVGARVPVADAERYTAIAKERGISLYAWVCEALEAAEAAHEARRCSFCGQIDCDYCCAEAQAAAAEQAPTNWLRLAVSTVSRFLRKDY